MEHRENRAMVLSPGADRRLYVPVDLPDIIVLGVCVREISLALQSVSMSVHAFEHSVPTSGAGTIWGQCGTFWT